MEREAATRQIEAQREFLRVDARQKRTHVTVLRRRYDYLDRRINAEPNDTGMPFLLAERAALRWALELMEAARSA